MSMMILIKRNGVCQKSEETKIIGSRKCKNFPENGNLGILSADDRIPLRLENNLCGRHLPRAREKSGTRRHPYKIELRSETPIIFFRPQPARGHQRTSATMKFVLLLLVVSVIAVNAKSDCEKHRDTSENIGTIMKLIPKCKKNGDYEELQCYEDSKFCVCYDKNGHPASPISSKIKECACHLKRKEKIDRGHDNPYVPQCEEDGTWAKKQCWDYNNSCWCVDSTGERTGSIVPEDKADTLQCS